MKISVICNTNRGIKTCKDGAEVNCSLTLNMEVEYLSQTSVYIYPTTRNHIPEISNLHNKHYRKIKSPLNLIHFSSFYCSTTLAWLTVSLFLFRVHKHLHFFVACAPRAGPSGRPVEGLGLRPLACWECGFEFRRRHGGLSVVSVLCC